MEQIDRAAFGAFVSQLRREKGLTQRQLAETLHISDKAVSKWETGVSIGESVIFRDFQMFPHSVSPKGMTLPPAAPVFHKRCFFRGTKHHASHPTFQR